MSDELLRVCRSAARHLPHDKCDHSVNICAVEDLVARIAAAIAEFAERAAGAAGLMVIKDLRDSAAPDRQAADMIARLAQDCYGSPADQAHAIARALLGAKEVTDE